MSKQKLITKESEETKKNIKSIKDKIKELKKELRKRRYNHIGQLYEILNKIVNLKKETNHNYAPRSLEWEEGINLKASEIRYIFSYQYISSYSKDKVLKGLINDSTICHFLAISSLLREPQWQNICVNKIIKKEITPSSISELTKDEIKLLLTGKLKLRQDDNYFLSATKTIRSIKNRLKERKHLIKSSPYQQNLISSIVELNKFIKDIKK